MNVRKFVASSARDALRKVKELLGPDAIILSNRAIPGGVEIMAVAASDMEMIVPPPGREAAPRSGGDYTVRLSTSSPAVPPVTPPAARVTLAPLVSASTIIPKMPASSMARALA